MAVTESMQYNNYLKRNDSYTNEPPLDYDNPSYNSPTRTQFSDTQGSPTPGSPRGSYREDYSHQEHKNPPPFMGDDDYPPSEENYNKHYGPRDDYQRDHPSGVTSGYDSDTIPRDVDGYGFESLPKDSGHQVPSSEEPYHQDDRYLNSDHMQPVHNGGYPGEDRTHPAADRGYPEDNFVQDQGTLRNDGPVQIDGYIPDEGYPRDTVDDGYAPPHDSYIDVNDGDIRQSQPQYGDSIRPTMETLQEAAVGGEPMEGDQWRAPDLAEVIEYLSSQDENMVANAANYLQHLTYGDDAIKNKTRGLNGIPILVELLNNPSINIHKAACGTLRNISFGKSNEENKKAIKNASGILTLIRLLRHTQNEEVKDDVTGVLWNLSSVEPLKLSIIGDAVPSLVKEELIPESGWDPRKDQNIILRNDRPWSQVFRNCLGLIRNVSSAGMDARIRLRKCEGLIDMLIHVLSGAVGNKDMDNKCVENAICIIRNLSFQTAQEKNPSGTSSTLNSTNHGKTKQNAPPAGKADVFSCFSGNKKKSRYNSNYSSQTSTTGGTLESETVTDSQQPTGVEYICNLGSIRLYVGLLADGSNTTTLEAAAGTIQNISSGEARIATNVRAHVRKEKGLPIMVELLRIDSDRVVLALARALRNLAVDARNKELIGQYAMKDLVIRLPGGGSDNTIKALSMESLTAVLHLLHEVIKDNQEHAKALRNANGIDAVIGISKSGNKYPPAVIKASIQVLHTLWGFKDLRSFYRMDGYEEKDFLTSSWTVKRSPSQDNSKTSISTSYNHTNETRTNQPEIMATPLPVADFHSDTLDSRKMDNGGDHADPLVHGMEQHSLDRDYDYESRQQQDQLDRREPQEEILMNDLHVSYPDHGSDVGSLNRPQVDGMSAYGRAPEPQVESRIPEHPEDNYQQEARSPSHLSDYGRADDHRQGDYGQGDYNQGDYKQDDYRQNGYDNNDQYSQQETLSRQNSYQQDNYGQVENKHDNVHDDYSQGYSDTRLDGIDSLHSSNVDSHRDDYGYTADYGQGDIGNNPSGSYSVQVNADSGQQNNPNSDSWV